MSVCDTARILPDFQGHSEMRLASHVLSSSSDRQRNLFPTSSDQLPSSLSTILTHREAFSEESDGRRRETHRAGRLIFGTLYPAYYSYKAVKSKDIKEYVKWMMYWIIFALFTTAETFTDIFLCWFPFYYELKIAFVAWLLSPYTKGSSLLYRKFVHPTLSSKEKEIDDCLIQAKDRSYDALVHFGKRGLNVAATAAVMAASKVSQLLHLHLYLDQKKGQGQGALSERLRSFSMQDLSTIRGDSSSTVPPSVTVRTSSKQSQPKPSRSASEGTGSSGTERNRHCRQHIIPRTQTCC
ncbi:receptor expression-enhancing protein 1 isoform X5 [Aphelocoma coerulescens]|uniref:receptor expression-enhancing protein 1 isoform X5 n=1 Tax=Aphelocoma coerulescens TaxID=39617 RepID=UPI003604CCAE